MDDDVMIGGIFTLDDILVRFTDEVNGLAGIVLAESPRVNARNVDNLQSKRVEIFPKA